MECGKALGGDVPWSLAVQPLQSWFKSHPNEIKANVKGFFLFFFLASSPSLEGDYDGEIKKKATYLL